MIIFAENKTLPISGIYKERIYDGNGCYHSQEWCLVEFTNEDYSICYGHFRGNFIGLAISEINNFVVILTSDYFYKLDKITGDLMDVEENFGYKNITISSNQEIIISDSYNIEKITNNLGEKIQVQSPIEMDCIAFEGWEGHLLRFKCYEFLNWQNYFEMIYNNETNQISIIKRK